MTPKQRWNSRGSSSIPANEARAWAGIWPPGWPAWRETPYFTGRERAALAFTEAVTRLAETHVPDAAYQEVAAEFGPDEVGALVSLIVTINAWNAVGVATRAWAPGSYQP